MRRVTETGVEQARTENNDLVRARQVKTRPTGKSRYEENIDFTIVVESVYHRHTYNNVCLSVPYKRQTRQFTQAYARSALLSHPVDRSYVL